MGLGNGYPCPECLGHRAVRTTVAELRVWAFKVGHPRSLLEDLPPAVDLECWRCPECLGFGLTFWPDPSPVWLDRGA